MAKLTATEKSRYQESLVNALFLNILLLVLLLIVMGCFDYVMYAWGVWFHHTFSINSF